MSSPFPDLFYPKFIRGIWVSSENVTDAFLRFWKKKTWRQKPR